ncbi:hypothetical protein TVAG_477960 [Trichomonas vaginalis G3]|uniref:Right handed beta helix domain-containing protein n=1 Tax=Trichomonas vaginalis (strain ATCC PRA-98 / G3) TaxID=412133 RepID=A2GAR2_TRIV3|nr:uncharacterized protein TVAGG3_1068830 [Trichomonas vaginalis G3]EAX85758.1 hypothetical protein TVAG_477960 [Trichomonas vaginalis G3]KAI5483215.1 hypothetical protein TVAGG3_1068830 [Trichomonas vaginalis G3]|eukprot:XP_001298688.1 hypothetical protein [Trichomonas vaginalis G3]
MFFFIYGRRESLRFSGPSTDVWTTFYTETSTYTYVNTSGSLSGQNTNYFVESVLFDNFIDASIIDLTSYVTTTKTHIATSSFIKCSNSQNGRCITFGSSGNFVQYRLCGFAISSLAEKGVYSYVCQDSRAVTKNYIVESSLTKISGEGIGILYHDYGAIRALSSNISDSNIGGSANYVLSNPYRSDTALVGWCQFKNNAAQIMCCFEHQNNFHRLSLCNVLDNTIRADKLILSQATSLNINQCYFKGNRATKFILYGESLFKLQESHFEDNTFYLNARNENSLQMTQIIFPSTYSSCINLFERLRLPDKTKAVDNPRNSIIRIYSVYLFF